MFKLATTPTYKRVIKVEVPGDMGRVDRQTFTMEFKRLSVSETKELVEEAQNDRVTDEDMIRRYSVAWEGVTDEDGNAVPFSTAALESAMDILCVRKAIVAAFVEDVFGKEAARKN